MREGNNVSINPSIPRRLYRLYALCFDCVQAYRKRPACPEASVQPSTGCKALWWVKCKCTSLNNGPLCMRDGGLQLSTFCPSQKFTYASTPTATIALSTGKTK